MATFTTKQQALEDAIGRIDHAFGRSVVTAPKAYAAHLERQAELEAIRRQHAEAIKTAPGYSAKLGAFVGPRDAVAFVNAQVEAGRPALKMAAE